MKSKEEIDELYHKYWDDFSNKYDDNLHYYSFVEGYTQCQEDIKIENKYLKDRLWKMSNSAEMWLNKYKKCQEDMADKKYTEEDMIKCWNACLDFNKPAGLDSGINYQDFINSLNKQD